MAITITRDLYDAVHTSGCNTRAKKVVMYRQRKWTMDHRAFAARVAL